VTAKLTVVYANPTDPEAFETHYRDVHLPMAGRVPGVQRAEFAKVFPKEDGTPTPSTGSPSCTSPTTTPRSPL